VSSPQPDPYDQGFYEAQAAGSERSAGIVIPLLNAMITPSSVLDIGCGVGTWLHVWEQLGVTDIVGLDGNKEYNSLRISLGLYQRTDLLSPVDLGRKFDLAMSLAPIIHAAT
jgi:SAM-dependent methyltransferase